MTIILEYVWNLSRISGNNDIIETLIEYGRKIVGITELYWNSNRYWSVIGIC